jgi:PAS domain S-box-containing protein
VSTPRDTIPGEEPELESRHRWLLWLIAEATSEVVRADDELVLFRRLCGMLVRHGFRFAWVGLLEPSGRRLSTSGVAARDRHGLAMLEAPTAEEEEHHWLIERIRSGYPWIARVSPNEQSDPDSAWARLALDLGARVVAFLPIGSAAIMHGVLVVGADDPAVFDDASMALLGRLAADCGAKLDRLGRSQGGAAAEVALADSLARWHFFFDLAPDAILLVWRDRVEFNDTLVSMFGVNPTKLDRSEIRKLFDPEVLPEMLEMYERRLAGRPAPARYQSIGKRTNGERFPILVRVRPITIGNEHGFAVYLSEMDE